MALLIDSVHSVTIFPLKIHKSKYNGKLNGFQKVKCCNLSSLRTPHKSKHPEKEPKTRRPLKNDLHGERPID